MAPPLEEGASNGDMDPAGKVGKKSQLSEVWKRTQQFYTLTHAIRSTTINFGSMPTLHLPRICQEPVKFAGWADENGERGRQYCASLTTEKDNGHNVINESETTCWRRDEPHQETIGWKAGQGKGVTQMPRRHQLGAFAHRASGLSHKTLGASVAGSLLPVRSAGSTMTPVDSATMSTTAAAVTKVGVDVEPTKTT